MFFGPCNEIFEPSTGITHQPSNKFSSIGCIDNLHKSLDDLSYSTKFIKPAAHNLLANLKLDPYGMPSCFMNKTCKVGTDCAYGVEGSYLKMDNMSMIMDDLQIKSSSSVIHKQILRKYNIKVRDIILKKIILHEADALNLLVSCLIFGNPLDDVFLSKKAEKIISYDR